MSALILMRQHHLVNTDPQRRCYNGCHFSSEIIPGQWEELEPCKNKEAAEERIKFWVDLNDYAVSFRGPEAKRDFKIKVLD